MSKKDTNESNLLFPVPDSGDVASDVWRLIIRSNAKMLNLLLQECPEIAPGQKITFSRIRVLTYLAQAQGEQVSIRDLAEELGVTSGGVSQMVDSLVKSDMVCRTASKDDRRVVYLSISDTAKKSLDVLSKYLHDRVAKAMTKIPDQDREIMARSLRTLLTAFYEDEN